MHNVLPASYANRLFDSIPVSYYWITLSIFIVVTLILVSRYGLTRGLKWGMSMLLAEYVFLLFCSTIFFRRTLRTIRFNAIPFKTYKEIHCGSDFLLSQCIMNVLVFIPIGMLLGVIAKRFCYVLFIGVLLSFFIELLQLVFSKGFCEIDDVIHNTLGCILGFCLYRLGSRCFWIPKRRGGML